MAGDAVDKTLDRKLAAIQRRPVRLPRIHPGRRQGRRHGVRHRRAGALARVPLGRAAPPHAGAIPRADPRDHPSGARGHHAHERQHEPRAHDPRAAVRALGRHARRPRQRHDRCSHRARVGLCGRARPAVPLAEPRPCHVRPPGLRPGRTLPRREPGPLQRDVQQRPGPRSRHALAVPRVPRGGRAQGVPLLPRSVRPEPPGRGRSGDPAALPQRHDRADARRRGGSRPAGVPQDRVSRPQGPGRARQVRPAPGGRHPRRVGGHHARRLPDAGRCPEVRGESRALRPEDQQRREPARLRAIPAADRGRGDRPGRGGEGVSCGAREAGHPGPSPPGR